MPQISEEIVKQKIEKREKIEHFEAEGQKDKHQIRADSHYIGEDDLYHLKGNVKITLFKKREGKDVFLTGDEVTYDKEQIHFIMRGRVKIQFEDLTFETIYVEYNSDDEVFKSDKTVQFTSKRLKGSAQNVIYSLKTEKLELWENITFEILPKIETSYAVKIQGYRFEYFRDEKRGILQGEGRFFHGQSQASADLLEFELFENEEQIKTLFLEGHSKAFLVDEEKQEETRIIEAEKIRLEVFTDQAGIKFVSAEGNSYFKSFSSPEQFSQIQAESMSFEMDPKGNLKEFMAKNVVRMIEQEEKLNSQRIIEGMDLTLDGKKNILNVRGDQKAKARIVTSDKEITAEDITLFMDENHFIAKGGIKVVLMSPDEEDSSVGFFSKQEPVYVTAQEMRYFEDQERFVFNQNVKIYQGEETLFAEETIVFSKDTFNANGGVKMSMMPRNGKDRGVGFFFNDQPIFVTAQSMEYIKETRRFHFFGNVKIWQQKKTLFSSEMEFHEESGAFQCSGEVKSVIPYKPEEEEEQRLEISAERMNFAPDDNLISFGESCFLKVKDISLKAKSLVVNLDKEEGDMILIRAIDGVIIDRDPYEGHGKEAIYDLEKKSIILTGEPVLFEKDKGKTEGDKLTFFISDDRIIVENKGRERSLTVIKNREK